MFFVHHYASHGDAHASAAHDPLSWTLQRIYPSIPLHSICNATIEYIYCQWGLRKTCVLLSAQRALSPPIHASHWTGKCTWQKARYPFISSWVVVRVCVCVYTYCGYSECVGGTRHCIRMCFALIGRMWMWGGCHFVVSNGAIVDCPTSLSFV